MAPTRDNYSTVLARGREQGKTKLKEALFANALKGNVVAQIFALKNYCGFTDNHGLSITGPEGGPIQFEAVREKLLSKLDAITISHEIIDTKAITDGSEHTHDTSDKG